MYISQFTNNTITLLLLIIKNKNDNELWNYIFDHNPVVKIFNDKIKKMFLALLCFKRYLTTPTCFFALKLSLGHIVKEPYKFLFADERMSQSSVLFYLLCLEYKLAVGSSEGLRPLSCDCHEGRTAACTLG